MPGVIPPQDSSWYGMSQLMEQAESLYAVAWSGGDGKQKQNLLCVRSVSLL